MSNELEGVLVNEKDCTTNASAILTSTPRRPRPATTEELLAAGAMLEVFQPNRVECTDFERIETDSILESFLNYVARYRDNDWLDHKVRVFKVVPCGDCRRPIVKIRFSHNEEMRYVDAVQHRDGRWFADVLREHECRGMQSEELSEAGQ